MNKAQQLREQADKLENAQAKAKALLAKKFTDEEKIAFFDYLYGLGSEWLELMANEGHSNHHVRDAFKPRVLQGLWGDDLYDWVYDLVGE